MASKDEKTEYDLLTEASAGMPEEDFSLEEILAEYGGGRQKKILRDVEAEAQPRLKELLPEELLPETPEEEEPFPEPEEEPLPPPDVEGDPAALRRETMRRAQAQLLAQEPPPELPRAPRPISMEEVVSRTVEAVLEEEEKPELLRPRRGLFSRRRMTETEELYQRPEKAEEEPEEEPIGPEETPPEAAAGFRADYHRRRGPVLAAFLTALVAIVPFAAELRGIRVPLWTGDLQVQSIAMLVCLAVSALLGRHVFIKGFRMLGRRRCTAELLICLAALASAADCIFALLSPERTAVAPYGAVNCWALAFAAWGVSRESLGLWETFRAAAVDDEPPYLVTETEWGACKQRGSLPGFYTAAMSDDGVTLWQTALLPVVLVASFVFAGLGSLGQGRGGDFLLNWSAILTAGATLALPLCWALPWSRLARHLQKTGCAVAGWSGAEKISRRRRMILADADLFPPGTIQLNGVKVYGETLPQAASYAATLTRCAGCGLYRLFDGLLRSECGSYEPAEDFSFYEEGGYSATIRGETVLLGTASFMRKMDVQLPGNIHLKTGVFLAVDRHLTAVFAVKYNAAENVDFALRMMRRSHITPILAARDPNITPALLRRKFHKGVKVQYPDLTVRVALSEAEEDRGMPRALLFREGLLPYADTVVGSRRLCRAVRQVSALSLLGSAAGTLLTFYLTFQGSYSLLTPLALLLFLLLWSVPVLLLSSWVGRY